MPKLLYNGDILYCIYVTIFDYLKGVKKVLFQFIMEL